jgi:hypothetical protein
LQTLPLFLGLRAAIFALVTAERSRQVPGETAARDRWAARDYDLNAANTYLTPPTSELIAVGGLSDMSVEHF